MAWHPSQRLIFNPYLRLKWYGFDQPIFYDPETGNSLINVGFQRYRVIEKAPEPELGMNRINNYFEGATLIFTKEGRKKYAEINNRISS